MIDKMEDIERKGLELLDEVMNGYLQMIFSLLKEN